MSINQQKISAVYNSSRIKHFLQYKFNVLKSITDRPTDKVGYRVDWLLKSSHSSSAFYLSSKLDFIGVICFPEIDRQTDGLSELCIISPFPLYLKGWCQKCTPPPGKTLCTPLKLIRERGNNVLFITLVLSFIITFSFRSLNNFGEFWLVCSLSWMFKPFNH